MVKVHRDEGVANRIGPESCAPSREVCGEASIGKCTGEPLSREGSETPGADAVQIADGNTCGRASVSACRPGVVEDPGMLGLPNGFPLTLCRINEQQRGKGQYSRV